MVRAENILSEEAIQEEKKNREERVSAEVKMDELRFRRRDALDGVNKLSDEIMAMQRRRQELNDEVQNWHNQFRQLGDRQRELRNQCGKLMEQLDELTKLLRNEKALPKEARGPRSSTLTGEIARLEREQQTKVLNLKEENALIDKIRQLRATLSEREKVEAKWMEVEADASRIRTEIELTREKLTLANKEIDETRGKRDEAMDKVKQTLGEVAHVLSEIRTKGKTRTELLERARAVGDEMQKMGSKMLELHEQSRQRISEARKNMAAHSGSRRHVTGEQRERSAEDMLSSLFKNGKIEMGVTAPETAAATGDPKDSRRRHS